MEKKFTRLSFGEKRHTEKEFTGFSDADWGPQTHRRRPHRVLRCRLGSPGPESYITLCREQREECVYCPRGKGEGDKEDGVREGRRSGMNKMEQSLQINVVIPSTHPK